MTIDLPFINQLLEKKGRESPVPPIILLWVNKSMYRELTPCCYELSNSTESKHNSLPLLCGYCKSYWTSQVHAFWRGAQQEQTDRLTLLSTRLYDFILFNGRYFIHFDNWRACLWVSRWWERLLEFVLSAPLLILLSTHSGSVWVLALAMVSLKVETEQRLEVVLKTKQFL